MFARRSTAALTLAVALLIVAGCSTAASQLPGSPVASPPPAASAPPPSPSPSPDVAALFLADMADSTASRRATVSGSVDFGSVQAPISGFTESKGSDSLNVIEIAIPGAPTSSATMTVGGARYVAQNDGPWFEQPAPGPGPTDLGAFLGSLVNLRDGGVVDRDGDTVHRLVPGSGSANAFELPPAVAGLTATEITNPHASLSLFAHPDGSIAFADIEADWTQAIGGSTVLVSMVTSSAFERSPSVTIERPASVWTRFQSPRYGYSIGHPVEWNIIASEKDPDPDVMAGSQSEYSFVLLERQPKAAADRIDAYARAFIKATQKDGGAKPETDKSITVGGLPGRRLTYHLKLDGKEQYTVFTLAIKGRAAYLIATTGPVGYETDVDAFHDMQVGTFRLEPAGG